MIDREKVLAVLRKRFPGATSVQFAAAANAIVGLEDEWEDVTEDGPACGPSVGEACVAACHIAGQVEREAQFRVFRRRERHG